jgi:hypothetical protein
MTDEAYHIKGGTVTEAELFVIPPKDPKVINRKLAGTVVLWAVWFYGLFTNNHVVLYWVAPALHLSVFFRELRQGFLMNVFVYRCWADAGLWKAAVRVYALIKEGARTHHQSERDHLSYGLFYFSCFCSPFVFGGLIAMSIPAGLVMMGSVLVGAADLIDFLAEKFFADLDQKKGAYDYYRKEEAPGDAGEDRKLRDYLEVFGFTAVPTAVELKKRFKELALAHHPDRLPRNYNREQYLAAEETMKRLNNAAAYLKSYLDATGAGSARAA